MKDPLVQQLEAAFDECDRARQSSPINLPGIKTTMEKASNLFRAEVTLARTSPIFWRWLEFAVHTDEKTYGPEITRAQNRLAKFLIEMGMTLDSTEEQTVEKTARELAEKAKNTELSAHIDFVKDIMDSSIHPEPLVRIKVYLEKEGVTVDPNSMKTWSLFLNAVHYLSPHKHSNQDEKGMDWTDVKNAVAKLVIDKGLTAHSIHDTSKTVKKETPLILAAHAGNRAIVRFLIDEKKAKVNAVDSVGKTAFDYAQENHDPELINYLKSKGAKPGKKSKHMAADHPALAQAHPPATQPKGLLSRFLGKK